MVELPRGTVTFLFTDLEGSTALLRQLGKRYATCLEEHLALLRDATAEHGGREIDTQGDAFFAAFARATDAVEAAVQAQRALAAHSWPDGAQLRVRMGLHTAEPSAGKERFVGLGVHRAARICAAGHGGQVLVSDATHQVLGDDPPDGVVFKDLGRCRLKDFQQPQHVFQVLAPGLRRDFPRVRTAAAPRRRGLAIAVAALAVIAVGALAVAHLAGGGSAEAVVVKADAVGVIEPASHGLVDQVPVGASPSHVVSGFGAVWVSNSDARSVSRIDRRKRAVMQTVLVGNGPSGLAVAGGAVWVANTRDGTASRLDPATNTVVQRVTVGNDPTGVAAGLGSVWVANSGDQTISRIDPHSGRASTISVHVAPTELAVGAGAVWITSASTRTVSQLDPRSGQVLQRIDVGGGASGVAVSRGSVWVANSLDGTVTRINAASGVGEALIPVGNGPNAITAGRGAVWVSDQFGGVVDRIDPGSNRVVQRIGVGSQPTGLALDRGRLWVAARATGAAHRGGTLRVLGSGIDSIDPAIAFDITSSPLVALTGDGLTGVQHAAGRDGTQIVPDLAVTLPTPQDDGRTYRFVLRRGIHYSNGALVRAQDVRPTFERLWKLPPFKTLTSAGPGFFDDIVGATQCTKAPRTCDLSRGIVTQPGNDSVVTFHLTRPDPDFLYKLTLNFADILPVGTPARVAYRQPLPATGPYMVDSYRRGHLLVLKRNPRFREWSQAAQPDGYPDRIEVRLDVPASRQVDAVLRGQADDTGGLHDLIPANRVPELLTQHNAQTHIEPQLNDLTLFLNTRVPPFNDLRVRRALNYAIDRRAVVRAAGGPNAATPTCQILPPNFPAYVHYCPYHAPNLRTAQRLISASGTRGMRVTVWTNVPLAPAATPIVALLRRLGYQSTVKVIPDKAHIGYFQQVYDSRNRAQAGTFLWQVDYPAPSDFLSLLSCATFQPASPNSLNAAEYCNPTLDARMRAASRLQQENPQLANQRWSAVEHTLVDAAPWLPLLNARSPELFSRRVGGYRYNPVYGTLIDQLWVH